MQFDILYDVLFPLSLPRGIKEVRISSFDLANALEQYNALSTYTSKLSFEDMVKGYLDSFFTYVGGELDAKYVKWVPDEETRYGRKEIVLSFDE